MQFRSMVVKERQWRDKKVDHEVTELAEDIAETALSPVEAARETLAILRETVGKGVPSSRLPGCSYQLEWAVRQVVELNAVQGMGRYYD